MDLLSKINSKTVVCSVVGLGYVGLPLAMEFVRAGFSVIGIDADARKVDSLKQGISYVLDVPSEMVAEAVSSGKFRPTVSFDLLSTADTISVCVPTPLRKTKDPDISYIVSAVNEIRQHLRPGQLVILESTTYPGTTDELVLGELSKTGLKVGTDFFLAFSPERVDPGNPTFHTNNTPKVVGGITPACTDLAVQLYRTVMDKVIPVSSSRVAETVKLLENTFRSVNIGLVNEFALMCDRMGIDIWEVIDAAATKPFGFMRFTPGPGIGGHCIPLDPMYLSWKARSYDFQTRFIELAHDVNVNMPRYVIDRLSQLLNLIGLPLRGSRLLILGVAYKPNIDDVRESPSLELIRLLTEKGAVVEYSDPHVASLRLESGDRLESAALTPENVASYDCLVLATAHDAFDYEALAANAKLIFDTRNGFRTVHTANVYRLGTGELHGVATERSTGK